MVNATNPTANDLINMPTENLIKVLDETPAEIGGTGEKIKADSPPVPPADGEKVPEAKAKPEEKPKEEEAPTGYWQDDQGKWHRPNGEFADATEHEAIKAAITPEGETSKEEVPDKPAIKRDYEALGPDGAPVEEVPDLKIKFTADGKEREANVDQLVRLAKMGYYNERRENEVALTKQTMGQAQQEIRGYQEALQERDTLIERYLADPNFREVATQEYQRLNSPQARLERLEQERVEQQQAQVAQQRTALATGYIEQTITPKVESVAKQFPSVTNEEIIGRITLLTSDLTVGGVVPPEYLPEVERRIDTDLRPWAEQRHTDRVGSQTVAERRARVQVDAAKVEAAMAKRQLARAVSPTKVGAVAPSGPGTPPKPKSAEDWMQQTFGKDPE